MLVWIVGVVGATAADQGYLRMPDIHGDTLAFIAEGDVWVAPSVGGTARRLTVDDGYERFVHFSPDGSKLAFTATYHGNDEVYVVDVAGGQPERLTWHPSWDHVVGFDPEGHVIFASPRREPHGRSELYRVPVDGGEPVRLPVGWAARVAMDEDSGMWAFNRIERAHRTWKRYRGGQAQDVWVGNPAEGFEPITDFPGTDAFPMWHDGALVFVSDEGGTANLWTMQPDGSGRVQLTDHTGFDVRWPGMGPSGRVAYMLAGSVRVYDPRDDSDVEVAIRLPTDRVVATERLADAGRFGTSADISPNGDRIAYVTRGDVFSVPADPHGVVVPIDVGSGSRQRGAAYGPDGTEVAYITDVSGEEALVVADAWGRGQPEVVVAFDRGWHFPPVWSPDGTWLAWSDDAMRLWAVRREGGEPILVHQAQQHEVRHFRFSPDGRYLAYDSADRRDYSSVFVYDLQAGQEHRITGSTTDDGSPVWSPDGRFLYFLGERAMDPVPGRRDFETVHVATSQPYLVVLSADDGGHPFRPASGLPPADPDASARGKKKKEKKDTDDDVVTVRIDWDGIGGRVVEVPMAPGRYSEPFVTDEGLFVLSSPLVGLLGQGGLGAGDPQVDLVAFDFEDRELRTVVAGVQAAKLSGDREHLLVVRSLSELSVVGSAIPGDPMGDGALSDGAVALDGVVVEVDPRAEWAQIFGEAWRLMRDFHWDQAMTGIDWPALRERYGALLPRLSTRDDLRDLMGELIGELATSHTYVWGGDTPRAEDRTRSSIGMLGARLAREGTAFKVLEVYEADPADGVRSPLAEPGVDIEAGDYILAIDGRPVDDRPIGAHLVGRAGKPVLVTTHDRPGVDGAREVVVVPLASDGELRYADWTRRNRDYVLAQTDGTVGYIHVPNMGARGLIAFDRWYSPQVDMDGLIVDVRWNGGGFVSQLLVERLGRTILGYHRSRGGGVWSYPYRARRGPFVVVTNQLAGSDGDNFPAAIQTQGLAPVIGMRSWGGVVGIRGDKRLVDGGMLTQPEYAGWWPRYDGWGLENHGVDPDIVVDNLPHDVARGIDAQLDRAIEEVRRRIAEEPPVDFDFGPPPDKSREAFEARER